MSYKDSKQFWESIKEAVPGLNRKMTIRTLPMLKLEDGALATDYLQVRQRWQRHFAGVELGTIMDYDDLVKKIRNDRCNDLVVQTLDGLPTWLDTEQSCHMLKVGSAPGPDRIPGALYKWCAPAVSRLLAPLYFKSAALAVEPVACK